MEATVTEDRLGEVTIPARFNGPETSANGGYACGALARFVGEPAEITLRTPPPLDRPLTVVADGAAGVRMLDGETLVAEGRRGELPDLKPPARPSYQQALVARSRHPGRGITHPLSGCFVCGPERDDGLGVSPGPLEGHADVGAAPFRPDESVAEGGFVLPEIVWSVLDCPSYVPSMWDSGIVRGDGVSLLGRLTAERLRPIRVGERLVVVGWPLESEGRKRFTASAILDEDGEVVARARATWIALRA